MQDNSFVSFPYLPGGGVYYLFTCSVHYLVDRKHTTLMNEQLKKRYAGTEKAQKENT